MSPQGQNDRLFKPINSTQLDLSVLEDIYLVPQLIINGGMNVIVGQAGAGKSVLVKRLAKTLATGGEFLEKQLPQLKVTIADLETPELIFREQMAHIGAHENLSVIRPDHWQDLSRGGIRLLEEALLEIGTQVFAIDPLSLAWRLADENSNSEADYQLNELKLMGMRLGLTLIYTWNTGQNMPGKDNHVFVSRGASARADRADIMLLYQRRDMVGRGLRVVKDKYMESTYSIGFSFKGDEYDFIVDSEVGKGRLPSRGEQCANEVLQQMVEGNCTTAGLMAALSGKYSENLVKKAMSTLVEKKMIDIVGRGEYKIA